MGIENLKSQTCQEEAKEARLRESQSPVAPGLDFSSPSDVSTVFSARATMLNVYVPAHQSTWLPRSSSSLVTLPVTTRRPESSPVIFNSPSVMTKSLTNSSPVLPLPKVVYSPTSRQYS